MAHAECSCAKTRGPLPSAGGVYRCRQQTPGPAACQSPLHPLQPLSKPAGLPELAQTAELSLLAGGSAGVGTLLFSQTAPNCRVERVRFYPRNNYSESSCFVAKQANTFYSETKTSAPIGWSAPSVCLCCRHSLAVVDALMQDLKEIQD